MQVLSNKSHGFTIVELLITITVGAIMMGTIVFGLGNYYQESVNSTQKTTQDTDTRSVLRTIENELVNTNGFITDLPVSATPLGANNNAAAWSYKGNISGNTNYRVLIGQTYATDKVSTDPTRLLVFSNPTNCSDTATSVPVKNAQIYFVAQDATNTYNLYRRTIVNSEGVTMCSTPFQKQTCASNYVAAYASVCKANDALLLSNIAAFNIDYYASSVDSTPIANQYTTALASDISAAKSVKITVTTNRLINGVSTQNSAEIRISRSY